MRNYRVQAQPLSARSGKDWRVRYSPGCIRSAERVPAHLATIREEADDSGQDLIEYALVAALVGLGAIASVKGLAYSLRNAFNGVGIFDLKPP
jgi:Flp pilus assembly pilin Flp